MDRHLKIGCHCVAHFSLAHSHILYLSSPHASSDWVVKNTGRPGISEQQHFCCLTLLLDIENDQCPSEGTYSAHFFRTVRGVRHLSFSCCIPGRKLAPSSIIYRSEYDILDAQNGRESVFYVACPPCTKLADALTTVFCLHTAHLYEDERLGCRSAFTHIRERRI